MASIKAQGQQETRASTMPREILFFLDSDDWIQKDCIEIMLATAIKTDATIVMSQSQAFPDVEDPLVIQRVNRVNRWLSCPPSFASKIPLHEISLENIPCVVRGRLFSKDFLIQNNLRFIEGRVLHEDNGF